MCSFVEHHFLVVKCLLSPLLKSNFYGGHMSRGCSSPWFRSFLQCWLSPTMSRGDRGSLRTSHSWLGWSIKKSHLYSTYVAMFRAHIWSWRTMTLQIMQLFTSHPCHVAQVACSSEQFWIFQGMTPSWISSMPRPIYAHTYIYIYIYIYVCTSGADEYIM
jgi:hypothetical protein